MYKTSNFVNKNKYQIKKVKDKNTPRLVLKLSGILITEKQRQKNEKQNSKNETKISNRYSGQRHK